MGLGLWSWEEWHCHWFGTCLWVLLFLPLFHISPHTAMRLHNSLLMSLISHVSLSPSLPHPLFVCLCVCILDSHYPSLFFSISLSLAFAACLRVCYLLCVSVQVHCFIHSYPERTSFDGTTDTYGSSFDRTTDTY